MAAVPKRRANRAAVAEQRIRCYQLRLSGLSVRQIATATGLSVGTVSNRIQSEINARVLPLADEVRKVELDRLDGWLARLNTQIVAGVAVARNVEVAVRVSERRAKLLGIDAPQQLEATVHEITQTDVALAELVREARVKAAFDEASIRGET